jgi:hypothetical protein
MADELTPPYWEHDIALNQSIWIFHATDQRGGPEHVLLWVSLHDDGVWRVELSLGRDPASRVLMSAVDMAALSQGLAMLAHGDKPTGVWLT